jgi:NADPH-dependent ferric siderophore reductase
VSSPEPASIGWNPGVDDRILLAGDDSVLPCIRTILMTLDRKTRGQVFIEVQSDAEVQHLEAPYRMAVTWLVRDRGQSLTRSTEAWLSEMLPVSGVDDFQVYAWIAGTGKARMLTSY